MTTDERPNYTRTLALLIVLAVVTYFGLSYAYALEDERIMACIGDLDGVSAVRITRTERTDVTPDELAALWQLTGESLWIGYERGGWSERAQVTGETVFYDGLKDGRRWWALFKIGTEYSVAWVFANTERYADADGAHYGHHPCGGWEVYGSSTETILSRTT